MSLTWNWAPLATATPVAAPSWLLVSSSTPALTAIGPENVLTVLPTLSVPAPVMVIGPVPLRPAPWIVWADPKLNVAPPGPTVIGWLAGVTLPRLPEENERVPPLKSIGSWATPRYVELTVPDRASVPALMYVAPA